LTGIYLGSASAQTITVTGNQIHDDYYGIFRSGPITARMKHNQFHNVTAKTAPSRPSDRTDRALQHQA
jgi:hypothetical protein